MPERETTITQKGQVTIPVDVRRALGLKAQDKVLFDVEGDVATLRKASSKLLAGYGAIAPRKRPEDLEALRREFEEGVAREVASER